MGGAVTGPYSLSGSLPKMEMLSNQLIFEMESFSPASSSLQGAKKFLVSYIFTK
jgi:hypothetical protein